MGIWVVGLMPDPGQRMTIGTHALTALYHPQQCDKYYSKLDKGFAYRHFKYEVPDPDEFVQLDMEEEQSEVQTNSKVFSGRLPLSDTIRPQLTRAVRAHKNRFDQYVELPEHEKDDIKDVPWRCPPAGHVFQTDNMAVF